MDTRKIATLTGWLMVVTFVTSIPAYFILYAPQRVRAAMWSAHYQPVWAG
jgi:hypothetical protein